MTRQLSVFTLLLITLLTGCQAIKDKNSANKLYSTLKGYEATVRWGNLAGMYDFLSTELRTDTSIPDNLNNIRVTGYVTLSSVLPVDEKTSSQRVSISYVFLDEQVERVLLDDQVWQKADDTSEWFRVNPIPLFR